MEGLAAALASPLMRQNPSERVSGRTHEAPEAVRHRKRAVPAREEHRRAFQTAPPPMTPEPDHGPSPHRVEADLTLLKWMVGFNLAMTLVLAGKAFLA
jgi:hypothetical protein